MHGGKSPGPPKGNGNALKSGRWSGETRATLREARGMLRAFRQALRTATDD
jgi:hypothetical protein